MMHNFLRNSTHDGDGVLEKKIVVKISESNSQGLVLNAVFALGKVLLLGKFKFLVISGVLEEPAVKMFTGFRKSKGQKSGSIGPEEISGSFHYFRVADMSQTLIPLGKCYLLHFL